MIDQIEKILEQVSDPVDVATVLIAGTAGFLVDAGLNAVGFLEPGYVGITSAAGALGVKKAIDARLAKRRKRKAREQEREDVKGKAQKLLAMLGQEADPLQQELKFFEAGIIDADELKASVDEFLKNYRAKAKPTSLT